MELVCSLTKMAVYTRATFNTDSTMAQGDRSKKMEAYMKGSGSKERNQEKDASWTRINSITEENGKITYETESEIRHTKTATITKENSRTTRDTARA